MLDDVTTHVRLCRYSTSDRDDLLKSHLTRIKMMRCLMMVDDVCQQLNYGDFHLCSPTPDFFRRCYLTSTWDDRDDLLNCLESADDVRCHDSCAHVPRCLQRIFTGCVQHERSLERRTLPGKMCLGRCSLRKPGRIIKTWGKRNEKEIHGRS